MLTDDNLDSMLKFVLAGEQPPTTFSTSPNRLGLISRMMPFVMPFLAVVVTVMLMIGIVSALSSGNWSLFLLFLALPLLGYLVLRTL